MIDCGLQIEFNYNVGPIVHSVTMSPAGIINGKPYYIFTVPGALPINYRVVYWNGSQWIFASTPAIIGGLTLTDLAYSPDTGDCPLTDPDGAMWTFFSPSDIEFFTLAQEPYPTGTCDCPIELQHNISGELETIILSSSGILAGHNYYLFNTTILGNPVEVIIYRVLDKWFININSPYLAPSTYYRALVARLQTENGCPVPVATESWLINDFGLPYRINIKTSLACPEPPAPEPEYSCYTLLVWNKQCEYAKCVAKYLQKLQYGILDCCEELDDLLNKKRALEILNCYDQRDIEGDTTDYNFFTYTQIKKLLNC